MKHVVTLLIVLGLAVSANAAVVEDFDSSLGAWTGDVANFDNTGGTLLMDTDVSGTIHPGRQPWHAEQACYQL